MRLSGLQRVILCTCAIGHARSSRELFHKYYKGKKDASKRADQVGAITKALERLIDRELLVGYGMRTPHKWYIKEVRLTPKGRKVAKELFGKQQSLPFKRK